MFTQNQIRDLIFKYFKENIFINTVVVGSDNDTNAKTDINYPMVQIETGRASTDKNYLTYRFTISIYDLQNGDNLNDIHSDAIRIANDFLNDFSLNKNFNLSTNVQFDVFLDDKNDRTAGVEFIAEFKIYRDLGTCSKVSSFVPSDYKIEIPKFIENDPVFMASPASGISEFDLIKWNETYRQVSSGLTIDLSPYITTVEADSKFLSSGFTVDLSPYSTITYVNEQVAGLVENAPETLNTLNELSSALGNDPDFATSMALSLGNRLRVDVNNQNLTSDQKANGRLNLDLGSMALEAVESYPKLINGRLGIGTVNPVTQFHVEGPTAGISLHRSGGASAEPFVRLSDPLMEKGGQIRGLTGSQGIRITNVDATVEFGRFTAEGKFGVGSNAPFAKIQSGVISAAVNSAGASNIGIGSSITAAGSVFSGEYAAASQSGGGALVQLYSNDGAPLANGDRMGGFLFGGSLSSSSIANSAGIFAFADGGWSSTSAPTLLKFETAGVGSTSRTERMRITSTGYVGINQSTPATLFHIGDNSALSSKITQNLTPQGALVTANNANANIQLLTASNSPTSRPISTFMRSRGTLSAPTAVQNNDMLGDLLFASYDGNQFNFGAGVMAYSDGTPTAGNSPMRISFVTGSNSGNRAERLTIKSDGKIGVGTTSPDDIFHITKAGDPKVILENSTAGISAGMSLFGSNSLARVMYRSETANKATGFYLSPNGTGNVLGWNTVFSLFANDFNADSVNFSAMQLQMGAGLAGINMRGAGTGITEEFKVMHNDTLSLKVAAGGAVSTGVPIGSTGAGAFKIGKKVSNYIEIEVDGVAYKLALVQ